MIGFPAAANETTPSWDPRREFCRAQEQGAGKSPGKLEGFTLVEVMIASIVLTLGITTAMTTLQQGFRPWIRRAISPARPRWCSRNSNG